MWTCKDCKTIWSDKIKYCRVCKYNKNKKKKNEEKVNG